MLHDPIPNGSRARTHAGFLADGATHTLADSQRIIRDAHEADRAAGRERLSDHHIDAAALAHFELATCLAPRVVRP